MKPHVSAGAVLAAALFVLPALASPASAKQLPPAFGTDHKPEGAAREASEPTGAAELEDRARKKPKDDVPVIHRAGRGARGGRVKIQLDGDEDGGGEDFGSDAGSDPDAGDF